MANTFIEKHIDSRAVVDGTLLATTTVMGTAITSPIYAPTPVRLTGRRSGRTTDMIRKAVAYQQAQGGIVIIISSTRHHTRALAEMWERIDIRENTITTRTGSSSIITAEDSSGASERVAEIISHYSSVLMDISRSGNIPSAIFIDHHAIEVHGGLP